jgi:hypothetical protein
MITLEQLKAADTAYHIARQAVDNLRQQYAEQECPFKVGDIVDICGRSHKGKRMQITSIGYRLAFTLRWVVVGRVLTKTGVVGKNATSFDQRNYEDSMK